MLSAILLFSQTWDVIWYWRKCCWHCRMEAIEFYTSQLNSQNSENMRNVQNATKHLMLDPFAHFFWTLMLSRLFIFIIIFIFQLLLVFLFLLAWVPPSWGPVAVWWAATAAPSKASSSKASAAQRNQQHGSAAVVWLALAISTWLLLD